MEQLKSITFLGDGEAIATRLDGTKLRLSGCKVESVDYGEPAGPPVIEIETEIVEIRFNKDPS